MHESCNPLNEEIVFQMEKAKESRNSYCQLTSYVESVQGLMLEQALLYLHRVKAFGNIFSNLSTPMFH
jgi:hypothetical protein